MATATRKDQTTSIVPSIPPRTIPGQLHQHNKGAIDWGTHGLIAYGCHEVVVVLDPESLQIVQTYHGHTANVVQVKWTKQAKNVPQNRVRSIKLASADVSGRVFLWNLLRVKHLQSITPPPAQKGVIVLEWQPENEDILAVVYAPSTLILWNTRTSAKIWSRDFQGDLVHFVFDPFDPTSGCALTTNGFLYIITGISADKTREAAVKKYHLGEGKPTSRDKERTQSILRPNKEKATLFATPVDLIASAEIVDVLYSPSEQKIIYFVTRNEILVMDVEISQILSIVANEIRAPSFAQILLCRECPEAIFCLHDNGSITVRAKRLDVDREIVQNGDAALYQVIFQTDVMKATRPDKFYSLANFPAHDTRLAGLGSDGKLLFFDFTTQPPFPPRLAVIGCLDSLTAHPTCVVMAPARSNSIPGGTFEDCPPNRLYCAAIGTRLGHIQLVDVRTGHILRDYSLLDVPIRVLKWIDAKTIVAGGYDDAGGPKNPIKNVVKIIDLTTGKIDELKSDRYHDQSMVFGLHVSNRRQYLVVLWKDSPLELWDLTTKALSRSPLTYNTITALEWSPLQYANKKTKFASPRVVDRFASNTTTDQTSFTEQFIMSLAEGLMVYCTVTNGVISEESKFQHRTGMNAVTTMAWEKKENLLLAGDSTGTIHFYHFKIQRTRTMPGTYGEVKKIKTCQWRSGRRFLILFADGIGIWEGESGECISSLSFGQEQKQATNSTQNAKFFPVESNERVMDIDWVTPENPLCIMADYTIRVLDLGLRRCVSPMNAYFRSSPIPSPHLFTARELAVLRTVLEHQPWLSDPQQYLEPSNFDSDDELTRQFLQARLSLLPSGLVASLKTPGLSMASRCARVAQFFGDMNEIDLWRLIDVYGKQVQQGVLQLDSQSPQQHDDSKESLPIHSPDTPVISTPLNTRRFSREEEMIYSSFDMIKQPESNSSASNSSSALKGHSITGVHNAPKMEIDDWPNSTTNDHLPRHFNLLSEAPIFRSRELSRAAQHERVSTTYDLTQRVVQKNIFLRQYDRSIQLLLDTPSNTANFRTDALKACLIAAVKSPDNLENTMKMVATNLIANNDLYEGVQLLCLLGRDVEACTYLQNYGHWEEAAVMAKSSLSPAEAHSVLKRWASHQRQTGETEKALGLYISLGMFCAARSMLLDLKHYERAVLLTEACEEMGMTINDLSQDHGRAVATSMYVGYASYLYELGLIPASNYYREKAINL